MLCGGRKNIWQAILTCNIKPLPIATAPIITAKNIRTIEQATQLWDEIFQCEERIYQNPLGVDVLFSCDKLLGKLANGQSNDIRRAGYLEILQDIIIDPQEIRRQWNDNDDAWRYYYFKKYNLSNKKVSFMVIVGVEQDNDNQGVFNIIPVKDEKNKEQYISNERDSKKLIYKK